MPSTRIPSLGRWAAYTVAAPTSSSGTITTATATGRYMRIGDTIWFEIIAAVTTAGTGAGSLNVALPTTAAQIGSSTGRENAVAGKQVQGNISAGSATLSIVDYANQTIIANGAVARVSGFYESQ